MTFPMYINMIVVERSVAIYCCGANWRCQFNCRDISASRAIAAERGAERNIATTTATDRIWGARDLRARGRRNSTSRGAMATGRQARLRAGEQHQTRCQRRLQRSVGGGRAERCGRYRVRRQFQRNHGKLIFEPLDRPGRAATVPGPPRKRVRARSVEKTQWMTRQSKNLEKHP